MKKLSMIIACFLAMLVSMPTMAQKKKQLDWKDGKMPELTDVKEINDYLLTCDTIINNLKSLDENLVWYKVQPVKVTEEDGTVSTGLWTRSGLPAKFQELFGTDSKGGIK